MSFSGYEDQRLPREVDDYELDQAYETAAELCNVCGDGVLPWNRIVFNGEVCCSGECAAVCLREHMADELAARAVPEPLEDDEPTTPIPVRIDGVSFASLKEAR